MTRAGVAKVGAPRLLFRPDAHFFGRVRRGALTRRPPAARRLQGWGALPCPNDRFVAVSGSEMGPSTPSWPSTVGSCLNGADTRGPKFHRPGHLPRSEEHTSELQSRL